MIAAPFPICITVFHSKLCWTTKKLSLCILYLLCSNVCRLFSMWVRSYQGMYAHFINRQKATILHAHGPACKDVFNISSVCVCVLNLVCYFYLPAMPSCLIMLLSWCAFYMWSFLCGNHQRYQHVINTTLQAHTAIKEEEPRFKAHTFTFFHLLQMPKAFHKPHIICPIL